LITDRRNRLTSQIIEASECFNSWSKAGLLLTTEGVTILSEREEGLDEESEVDFIE